jgi:hypothetical protein
MKRSPQIGKSTEEKKKLDGVHIVEIREDSASPKPATKVPPARVNFDDDTKKNKPPGRTMSLLRFGVKKSQSTTTFNKEKRVQIDVPEKKKVEEPEKPVPVASAKVDEIKESSSTPAPDTKKTEDNPPKTLKRAESSIGRFLNVIAEKIQGKDKSKERENKLHATVLNHHQGRFPFKGEASDHPMEMSKRSAFRIFFVMTCFLTVLYSIDALFETVLYPYYLHIWLTTEGTTTYFGGLFAGSSHCT